MRESPLWHCVSTAKCLYLSEPQFQPKEENSLLEINPIKRPAQYPLCTGDGSRSLLLSFSQMPQTPRPAALPTSPARCPAPTSRSISTPAASAPWQQLCESQPRGTLGVGGVGGKTPAQNQSPLGGALREGIPTRPPAAQIAVFCPLWIQIPQLLWNKLDNVFLEEPPDSDGLG